MGHYQVYGFGEVREGGEEVGSYKTAHAAVCAMASRIDDYQYMFVRAPNGVVIARYSFDGDGL